MRWRFVGGFFRYNAEVSPRFGERNAGVVRSCESSSFILGGNGNGQNVDPECADGEESENGFGEHEDGVS